MLVIFDRLAEAFPDLHLSPANYYLTHGTGNFDVFNSELVSLTYQFDQKDGT